MYKTATSVDLYRSTAPMRAFHLAWLAFLRSLFVFCASALRLPQTTFAAPPPAKAIPVLMLSIAAAATGFLVKLANTVRPGLLPAGGLRTCFAPEQTNKAQLR